MVKWHKVVSTKMPSTTLLNKQENIFLVFWKVFCIKTMRKRYLKCTKLTKNFNVRLVGHFRNQWSMWNITLARLLEQSNIPSHPLPLGITDTTTKQIPNFRTNKRKFCPTVMGTYFWNDLPLNIRKLDSKSSFKQAIKRCFLSRYYVFIMMTFFLTHA